MSKVFISYVRADEHIAERLYKDLKQRGAGVWLDKYDRIAGQGLRGAIKERIDPAPDMNISPIQWWIRPFGTLMVP